MAGSQLPLFQRKTYKGIIPNIPVEIQAPGGDKTVIETLPAYYTYLTSGGFSQYTPDDFTGDLKKFGIYLKDKRIQEISERDIQGWISFIKAPSPRGEGLRAKTVSRKLTALSNYFQWLVVNEVIPADKNPMLNIANTRVSSPLPEILFETECTQLLTTASGDSRTYLLFLLFLETGIKLEELFGLRVSHFDFSNKYAPEMMIKHTGKKEKKSRKLKLPPEIIPVFTDYVGAYKVDDVLFPYTPRFVRYLITETSEKAGVKKKVSAQILRDTCAIRQLRRGEGIERVLMRLGLSETTWEDAKVKYEKLSARGI
jgi:site-specific recombinase XerD